MNCLPVFFFNKIWSIVRYNYKDPSFQYIQYFELQIKFVDTRRGMELLLLYRDENTINRMQYMLKWRKHFLRLKIIKRARWLCPFINDINFLRRIVQHDMKIWNDIQSCYIFSSLIQVTDNSLKFEMVYYFYTTLYMISILSLRPWNLNLKKPTQPIGYSKPEYFDVEFFHIYIFSAYTSKQYVPVIELMWMRWCLTRSKR